MEIKIKWEASDKQLEALDILEDQTTTELLYGGGAGGGKSYLGCAWLIYSCLKYPGSRWLMGRAVLKNLKASTLLTFFQLCKRWGLRADQEYTYHSMEGIIRFANSSEIYLKDLAAYPSDPDYDALGSTEYCGAFIDEGSQITSKAKNIVISRLRYRLEEFGIIPKLLFASNPCKNFLYTEFYKPALDGILPQYRKFVKALVTDNPYLSPLYVDNLKRLDKESQQRLLYGNWEYDDDPSRLIEYDKILDIFTNSGRNEPKKYITSDLARFGKDKTIIVVWEDLYISKILMRERQGLDQTQRDLEQTALEEKIPRSNILVDEDGMGGGVVDNLKGIKGFVNNSRAIQTGNERANYANLKTQCYFMLAQYINEGKIGCYKGIPQKIKESLIEDLEQVKRKNMDKDGPLEIVSKETIKEALGRSPDFSDAVAMRMKFELIKKSSPMIFGFSGSRESVVDFNLGQKF